MCVSFTLQYITQLSTMCKVYVYISSTARTQLSLMLDLSCVIASNVCIIHTACTYWVLWVHTHSLAEFHYRWLQGNLNSSRLQCKVRHLSALAVGSAAQVAAIYCLNNRTLDPQIHLCLILSQLHCCLHPTMFSSIFRYKYYHVLLIATHLPTLYWWKAELAWAPQV